MEAYFKRDGTLVIEAEDATEARALKGWHSEYKEGDDESLLEIDVDVEEDDERSTTYGDRRTARRNSSTRTWMQELDGQRRQSTERGNDDAGQARRLATRAARRSR